MAEKTWAQESAEYKAAGFTDGEILEQQNKQRGEMSNAGFSGQEIDEYFGIKTPDLTPTKELIQKNLGQSNATPGTPTPQDLTQVPGAAPITEPPTPAGATGTKKAQSFVEALEAGFQMSVTGLVSRGKNPEIVTGDDASMFYNIAAQSATLAGDLPAMLSGGISGGLLAGAFGTAAGPIGAAAAGTVGISAGAMAMPAALRTMLMQHYEKGDIKTFRDFWERASATFIDTSKAAVVGGATAGVGGVAAKIVGPLAAPAIAKTSAVAASEIATMVTVGKALEGQTPNLKDFTEAAVMVGGLHVATAGAGAIAKRTEGKLRSVYAETGMTPSQVAEHAQADVTVKQDLLAENVQLPEAYQDLSQTKKPETVPVDPKLTEQSGVFGEFSKKPEQVVIVKPVEEAAPGKPAKFSEAETKVLSQIGEKAAKPSTLETVKEGLNWDKFYAGYVDRLDPINEAIKTLVKDPEKLATVDNPYKLARMANDYKSKAKHTLERGVLDFATMQNVGKPLNEIMKPVGNDVQNFNAYLVSARAVELAGRGIESGVDLEAAKQVVKDGGKKFGKIANELVDYQNGVLKYLKDSGYLTEESFSKMKEANKAYIPFSRLDEEGAAKGGKSASSPVKAIKGSTKKIANPLESVIENTAFFMKLAEQNRALTSLVKLAEATPDNGLIEKVPAKLHPVEISSSEVGKILKANGAEVSNPEAFTIFRKQGVKLAEDEFAIFRNGKREIYKAEPELAAAIKSLDGDQASTNLLFKLARGVSGTVRLGLSLSPDFILRNFFRDQLTAGSFSKYGTIPFMDAVKAMGDIIGKTDVYYDWMKSGGAGGSFLELDKNYIENNIYKLSKETGLIDKVWNVAKTPLDMMRIAGELSEQSTRLAEFKRTTKGSQSIGNLFEGGFAAREVTVDFTRMGAKIKALNAITAFQNVSIQGLDRTVRAFKDDPTGLTTKALAGITLPSVLLWYANKDDPRYKEIPNWEKNTFWLLLTDKVIYRIPKPAELGILFGSLPERILDAFFTDNPRAFSEFEKTVMDALAPSMVPNIATPVIEQYFNKSLFTGNKIVPDSVSKILPEYQYNHYTSETGKLLGKMVATVPSLRESEAASPLVIENYIRAWSGSLGGYFLQLADKALTGAGVVPSPVKPVATLADIPVVKAFVVRHPSASAQSLQDFYDKYERQQKITATIQSLAQSGNFEALQKEMSLQENQAAMVKLDGIKTAITNQNKALRFIYDNPTITPDEKRQLIDGLYFQMIEEAKLGNKLSDQLEKTLKAK